MALIVASMLVCSRRDQLPGDPLRVLVVVKHVLLRAKTLLLFFQYFIDKIHGLVRDVCSRVFVARKLKCRGMILDPISDIQSRRLDAKLTRIFNLVS
jgi:hypothetical protein